MSMAELLQEYLTAITDSEGATYIPRSYGDERADGTWMGWLEFHPTDASQPVLQTDQETSQPNRVAIEYWATGLEPIYFEGAFARAHRKES
jgi:hypothetical protein